MKETVNSFFYVKFKKILKQLLVNPLKTALFDRATTKTSRSLFVLIMSSFVHGSNINLVDFYETHVNDTWLLQNKLPGSFDHLTLTPS